MIKLWLDCETTSLNVNKGFAFQYSYFGERNNDIIFFNDLKLCPKNYNDFEFDLKALQINHKSPEMIQSYESEEIQIKKLINDLNPFKEKFIICGYNIQFDIEFLKATLFRNKINYFNYFQFGYYDVMQLVKSLVVNEKIKVENIKLGTIAEYFGLNKEDLHDAMQDIMITKQINDIIMKDFKVNL